MATGNLPVYSLSSLGDLRELVNVLRGTPSDTPIRAYSQDGTEFKLANPFMDDNVLCFDLQGTNTLTTN